MVFDRTNMCLLTNYKYSSPEEQPAGTIRVNYKVVGVINFGIVEFVRR